MACFLLFILLCSGQILLCPVLIVVRQGSDDAIDIGLRELSDELGRDTSPQLARTNLGARQDERAGSDDGTRRDVHVVEDGTTHADEHVIVNLAAMQTDVVADGDVIADLYPRVIFCTVQAGAVLDADAIADADLIDVATDDGAIPDGGLFADDDVADDGCGFGYECGGGNDGGFALEGEEHILGF